MSTIFRTPAWMMMSLFAVIYLPIILITLGLTLYSYDTRPDFITQFMDWNASPMIVLLAGTILLTWAAAIIVEYGKKQSFFRFFLLPLTYVFGVLLIMAPSALMRIIILPQWLSSLNTELESLFMQFRPEAILMVFICCIALVVLATVFAVNRLTAVTLRDRLLALLATIFLPLGFIWLQPRLRALLERPGRTISDHLLD